VRRSDSILVASIAYVLLFAQGATGQIVGTTTGAIEGSVTDTTGAVLPGVTITAASDAHMAPRSTTTAPDGSYRLSGLPPGNYRLSYALSGFASTGRDDVRVNLGATTTVDVSLGPGRLGEIVTVNSGGGAVDRRSTMVAAVFDARELAQLPGARTIGSILAATPAVQFTRFDVGGSTAFAVGPFSVYGTSGFNRPTIEGISVSNMNPFGFALDYGTFTNVSVGTGAYGPEWPSPGLHMQFITKSGGNRYSGALYAGYEDDSWQSHNIDEEQLGDGASAAAGLPVNGANRLQHYHDLNGDIGGYLRKDRLWWYASARDHAASARQVNFPLAPLETRSTTFTAKGTWRVNDAHQFVIFAQGSRSPQPIRLDGFLRTATTRNTTIDSTTSQLAKGLVWKSEWSAVIGNRLFIEARAGQFAASRAERPNGDSPRTEDLQRPEVVGGNRDWREEWQSDEVNAAASYFRDGPFGQHQFKAGLQSRSTICASRSGRRSPAA
jgi:carboxypeptidase family protein